MLGLTPIKSFFSSMPQTEYQETATSIDIILYTFNLSSSPQLISSYQERLREITSKIKPGAKQISAQDQVTLAQLYLDIEKYLVEDEPLKKITKEDLRKRIGEKFHLQVNKKTFWDTLSE